MTFSISKQQLQKFSHWISDHNKTCKYYDDGTKSTPPMGAIGGQITYTFTPTGLGNIITARCHCGSEIDLTEYNKW